MVEHEVRPEGTGLAYGKYLTKPAARKLGVLWPSQVGESLAGQEYKPSLFQALWDDNEEEEQEESQSALVAVYQRLLDIFCKLFIKEE